MVTVDEEESVEPPNSSASSTTRVTPPPTGLFSAGTAQSTTGTISTLMEAHAQSGWVCELVVGSDDARVRACEKVELLVDTWGNRACMWASRLHSRCTEEWATSRAQDRDWRAVETPRYEDRKLSVSRRRTSSGLHCCRCEATNSECLKVDGQRHRNIHPSWQAVSATV